MATNTKASLKASNKVRAGIQSTFDQVRDIFIAVFQALIALGLTLEEIATLAGESGLKKRTKIVDYIRDTIRGVKQDLSASALELTQKLGVIEEATDITPPEGGKVFRVRVMVDRAKKWKEYILASCPRTPKNWDILKAEDQFESPKRGSTEEEVILLWFGSGVSGTMPRVEAWAISHELRKAHGRIPAAVIGTIPGIIGQLQNLGFPYSSVGIVSTFQCTFGTFGEDPHVPCAWRGSDGEREASLRHVLDGWSDDFLFAFVRK